MVAEKDIEKVREALKGTEYEFSDDRLNNQKKLEEGVGHTQGEHEVIANHKDNEFHLGFFLFRREQDNSLTIREYFMQENENGEKVPMVLERHCPKELVDLEYTEEETEYAGTRFRTSTPESVYAKKISTRHPKNMLDIEALKDKINHSKIEEMSKYHTTLKIVEPEEIIQGNYSLLDSGIEATEESTRAGAIYGQAETIKSVEKSKIHNLKMNIARAIAGHYTSRDERNEKLIIEQADTIFEFLKGQKKLYEQLKKANITPHKLKTDENGEVVFDEGTLIHCAGQCDYDKLRGIRDKGIMAGDFVGIPEFNNDETYFCADFYRADTQMKSSNFIERIQESDKITGRGPFGKGMKNITKIAFIFDFNDDIKSLTDTDMYLPENSEHVMQLALKLLESYKGEKNGQASAIPYGIPPAFISGIIARR